MDDIPTPEADACHHHCVTHSGPGSGLVMKKKMQDLERRLTVARTALRSIQLHDGPGFAHGTCCQIAHVALTQTAPQP